MAVERTLAVWAELISVKPQVSAVRYCSKTSGGPGAQRGTGTFIPCIYRGR